MGSIYIPRRARPSWASGFARSQSNARFPSSWRGLIGHWATSLGATGLTLFDVSGQKNNGVLTNMPSTSWEVEATKQAILYTDDGNARVVIPNSMLASISSSITIEYWFKGVTSAGAGGVGNWDGSTGFILGPDDGDRLLWFAPTGASSDNRVIVTGLSLDDNQWHHAVGTFTGGQSQLLYLDGVLVGSDVTSIPATLFDNGTDFDIGERGDNTASSRFMGHIEDLAIYNRALAASESQLFYTRGLAGYNAILERKSRSYPATTAAPPVAGNPWNYYAQQAALVG